MITLAEKKKCTGCTACEQICPVGAISMKSDKEGFLAPVIDEKSCISCKKCIQACPVGNSASKAEPIGFYGAKSKDEDVVKRSSSGGMFSTFANEILAKGGIVFGAGFDDDFNVVHKSAETAEQLQPLMCSKYVQSDLGNTYKEVIEALTQGRQVLFSGTPCQCAGLRGFLGKSYDNLLLLDFVCHGVPSPGVYRNYLSYMSREDEITSVCFRDKSMDKSGHQVKIQYKNSPEYTAHFAKDVYILAFLQDINLRKSCYNCTNKNFASGSDITIGDFWGVDLTDSILKDEKGVSMVVVNTPKGSEWFEKVRSKVTWDESTYEDVLKGNPSIIKNAKNNPLRERYLKDSNGLNIKKLADKYCGSSYAAKFRRLIARCRKDR